jgi:membrane fusion protein (multidrug efflux system)
MSSLRKVLIVSLLIGVSAGALAYWRTALYPFESTDNTYLKAHMTVISPREQGYVKSVLFENNQKASPGDVLVIIDDADFQARVAEGEAQIQVVKAQIQSLEADKRTLRSRILQQQAERAAAEADLSRTAKDTRRFGNLVSEGAVSSQTHDAADAEWKQARAQVDRIRSVGQEIDSQLAGLDSRIDEAQARIKSIQAGLEMARIALSHTRIVAPIAGTIGNRSVQVGQLVKPGTALGYLIPADGLYLEANFKETQIEHMRPGQPVDISIDAYPALRLQGTVDSFAPASGSEFSLLPPENATGNFTKIVRRVPVKIIFNPGTDLALLRPGLSANAKVRVR